MVGVGVVLRVTEWSRERAFVTNMKRTSQLMESGLPSRHLKEEVVLSCIANSSPIACTNMGAWREEAAGLAVVQNARHPSPPQATRVRICPRSPRTVVWLLRLGALPLQSRECVVHQAICQWSRESLPGPSLRSIPDEQRRRRSDDGTQSDTSMAPKL